MVMVGKILFYFSLFCVALASTQKEDYQVVLDELKSLLETRDEGDLDFDDLNFESEARRVIEDHGFDLGQLMSDFGFLNGITGLFKSGDGKRWATLNFVYQLACYQGRGGSLLSKALWVWSTYNGYGCYCGSGWYSGNYLDATDYCCRQHDNCYDDAIAKYKLKIGCHTYTTPYTVQCCEKKRITKCTDGGPSAGRALCECDQAMSRCVAQRKAKNTYNKAFYKNRSKCQDAKGKFKKGLGPWQILKSCKHFNKPRVTFPVTRGSQGSCPAKKKKKGWLWGK